MDAVKVKLNQGTCHKLVITLVLLHLDYSNSMLSGLPDSSINTLQKVQNRAAWLVLGRSANNSSTENTKQWHWLPINLCMDYKVLTLVHKCQHQKAPKYLQDLLREKISKKARSMIRKFNTTTGSTIHKKTFASWGFSIYAPTKWNKLPNTIKEEDIYD